MKKIIFALSFILLSVGNLFAQSQVPHHVMDAFKQSHPNAFRSTWSVEGTNFSVSYYDETKLQHYKVYNSNDQIISHKYEVVGTNIPASINDHYKKLNAVDGSYKVWTVIDKEGNTSFSTDYNNVNTNFDKSGKVLK